MPRCDVHPGRRRRTLGCEASGVGDSSAVGEDGSSLNATEISSPTMLPRVNLEET
jgi:hypothetical protein